MEPMVPISAAISLIVGALIAFVFFGTYFRKRKSEVVSITKPAETAAAANQKNSRHQQSKKSQSKPHQNHADKDCLEYERLMQARLEQPRTIAVMSILGSNRVL